MAVKRTIIEETPDEDDPTVVRKTKTVVNPDIHTPIVDAKEELIDSSDSSTIKQTKVVHEPLVKTEHPQKIYETKKAIFRSWQVIWYILAVVEIIIGFRVALRAIGANPFSGFVSLIYGISDPLTIPFRGIIPSSVFGNSVIEWSSIIAALVYILIAWGLVSLINMGRPVTPEEVEQNV
jgi:hypothetical protein